MWPRLRAKVPWFPTMLTRCTVLMATFTVPNSHRVGCKPSQDMSLRMQAQDRARMDDGRGARTTPARDTNISAQLRPDSRGSSSLASANG
uniref:Putative secreted protein n=1 Tax=Ixodes ricinus TaxID=34613 RepID=A0A6B0UBU6_IXORI